MLGFDFKRLPRGLTFGNVRDDFYVSNKGLIESTNYRSVRYAFTGALVVCVLLVILSVFFSALAEQRIAIVASAIFFLVGVVIVNYTLPHHLNLTRLFYYLFCAGMSAVLIYLGLFSGPSVPATLFFLGMIVIPLIYVERPIYTIVLSTVIMAVFCVITYLYTPASTAKTTNLVDALICYCILLVTIPYIRNVLLQNMEAQEVFSAQAATDKLTGLSNKGSTEQLCRYYIGDPPKDVICAMFVLDIDDFKEVNDIMGHKQGDQVLIRVASELKSLFRREDVVGRFGGDEFVVLMKDVDDIEIIKQKATQLNAAVKDLLRDQMTSEVSCSFGIALNFHQHYTYNDMFTAADKALYRAKRAGKGRYVIAAEPVPLDEKPLIMVVDDTEISRTILSSCLGSLYEIIEGENGAEALELLERYGSRVRGILLDIEMPVMDGRETLYRIQQNETFKDIPVIVITAHGRNEEEFRKMRVVDFVEKPFDPRAVLESVARMVGS